ncbi:MAG: acyl-ACP--UDP-N-acetylglucosamine O-acyltransferase [Rhodospirillales bacterium]|nr:acyl-ACP--UDP-N-acetylglucosamine O-acyltransferase [Rhodospirillales bacterium]
MSLIHATSIVAPGAAIGEGVRIGPWCSVGPHVTIEDGAELISHVVVDGRTRIGAGARLFPFCTVGLPPQDLKYKGEDTLCEVGARTQVRENVTIHRGTVTGSGATRVGADCLLMAVVHVAHDCMLGDGVIVASAAMIGGHVAIGDGAVIGAAAGLHQFVRIGRGAMIGGMSGVDADVIPFGSVIGNRARLAGLNLVRLKRLGVDRAQIHRLRAAFRLLFRGDGVFAARVASARGEFGADPLVTEVLDFVEAPSRRGLTRVAAGADAGDDDAA